MVGIKTKYGETIFAIEAEKGSGACNGDSGNGISIKHVTVDGFCF